MDDSPMSPMMPRAPDGRPERRNVWKAIYGEKADPRGSSWRKHTRKPQSLPPMSDRPAPPPAAPAKEELPALSPRMPSGQPRPPMGHRRPGRSLPGTSGAGWGASNGTRLAPLPEQPGMSSPVQQPSAPAAPPPARRRPKPNMNPQQHWCPPGGTMGAGALHGALSEANRALSAEPELREEDELAESQSNSISSAALASPTTKVHEPEEQHKPSAKQVVKQHTMAQMQKLFFQEMSKGQDANGAFAEALLRLHEYECATRPSTSASVSSSGGIRSSEGFCGETRGRPPTPLVNGTVDERQALLSRA